MAFHEVRFPDDIARGARGGPERRTQIVELASGREERNASWQNSRRRYDVAYGLRRADDLAAMVAFFEARNGRLYGFRFKDWADYKSCPPSGIPGPFDQEIGTGDGVTTTFKLSKRYASGETVWTRAITKPVAGTVRVAVNGAELSEGDTWTLDPTTGEVTFIVAPAPDVTVSAGFQFDVPVRFDSDALDVTLDLERLGSIASIPLVELRLPRAAALQPVAALTFGWNDVFADHSALAGGADWTGWGLTPDLSAEVPLEFFLRSVLPALAPDGATLRLESPLGVMHLRGRVQPPPRSVLRTWTLDLANTLIERGRGDYDWGQIHLWGEVSEAETGASSPPSVGVSAAIGDTQLTLKDDADTAAFLTVAGPGSIAILRTNATAPGYHPEESREIVYIAGVAGRTLTLSRPLTIAAPVSNPFDYPGETNDPSTVTLLAGSLLALDAAEGAQEVTLVNAAGISVGDWVYLSTSELPTPTGNQFAATMGVLLDPTQDFGDILINEEMHEVVGIAGNTLALREPLGKNKLTAWNAACVRIDPIENATLLGGHWVGYEPHAGANPWDHQYVWARYCAGCTIQGMTADKDPARDLDHRRMGQAIRSDTGAGNRILSNTIGQGGGIAAGEAYGISLRRGERNSVVGGNDIERCRHSVELWGTTAGCIVEGNTVRNDTSSSLDTHGSWNKGVIIRDNVISNDGLLHSPDLGGLPDAIRIGNNKFLFDEDIQVLNNRVTGYRGTAISVVPGARRVTVDGLDCDDVDRILGLARNSRHPAVFSEDVTVRNVTADDVRDRLAEVDNTSNGIHVKRLTLENWVVGGSGLGTIDDPAILNFRLFWVEDLVLKGIRLEAIHTQPYHYAWHFEDVAGLTLTDCYQAGGQRGIRATRTTGISGDITIDSLEATTPQVFRQIEAGSGALTVTHNAGYVPVVDATTVTVTLVPA